MTTANNMAPFEIRDKLISDLKATRIAFFKAETAIELDSMTKAQRESAGKVLVEVNIAITKMENIELKSIADDLKAISTQLINTSDQLRDAINDMKHFKLIITRANAVLTLLERAAKIAGISLG